MSLSDEKWWPSECLHTAQCALIGIVLAAWVRIQTGISVAGYRRAGRAMMYKIGNLSLLSWDKIVRLNESWDMMDGWASMMRDGRPSLYEDGFGHLYGRKFVQIGPTKRASGRVLVRVQEVPTSGRSRRRKHARHRHWSHLKLISQSDIPINHTTSALAQVHTRLLAYRNGVSINPAQSSRASRLLDK